MKLNREALIALQVLVIASAVMGQAFTPTGPQVLSVAGKCFLTLALTYFVINAAIYVVREKKARMPQDALGAVPGAGAANDLFDKIFTEERLENSKSALTFVSVIGVLMLFILFRAREQGIDVTPGVQNFYIMATVGVIVQAVDVLDCRISSDAFGNLSEKLGMLAVYVGYGGILYGLFTVRRPEVPLSTAAQCITMLTCLVCVMQLLVKFLEYKKHMMAMIPKVPTESTKLVPDTPLNNLFDSTKLNAALSLCDYIPMICTIIFYLHFRVRFATGEAIPPRAEQMMYATTGGIFIQALGVLVLADMHRMLGLGCRTVGMILTYVGFAALVYYGITVAPIESTPVEVYLELITVVVVLQIGIVVMEEFMASEKGKEMVNASWKKMFQDMLATSGYATVLGLLMLYCHFRGRITGDAIPDFTNNGSRLAGYSIFAQILLVILEGALSKEVDNGSGEKTLEVPMWTTVVKAISQLALMSGFGVLVYSAFVIGVPVGAAAAQQAP